MIFSGSLKDFHHVMIEESRLKYSELKLQFPNVAHVLMCQFLHGRCGFLREFLFESTINLAYFLIFGSRIAQFKITANPANPKSAYHIQP